MKILAIRGCNLASLAGEFEIDLARAPLADAGVFAIVGNTGAGKSTLLDALCVALFDRTPRLTNHSRGVVGSGDARRYRARWSVRRARGQTAGKFQDQQVSLTALDGRAEGRGNERLGG